MKAKRLLSGALALALTFSVSAQALAAGQDAPEAGNPFPYEYTSTDGTFSLSKISHPESPANYRHPGGKYADGLVDYLGNGKIGLDKGQGDRGQSYCWGALPYGDWMYVNTLYNAAGSTAMLFPTAGGDGYNDKLMDTISNCLYRGDIFTAEADGVDAGCALVKINVKTGETKLIMTNEMTEDSYGNTYGGYYAHAKGMNPQFRNAIVFNDKLYFIGAPSGIPSIWEIDPNNDDAFRRVYADPEIVKNPRLVAQMLIQNKITVAIRGITAFEDRLVISCVSTDGNPYIAVSNTSDPTQGFTQIAHAWEPGTENKVEGELLGYPACHLSDSIYGGSIWEMIPFDGDLYVAMCTGTQENRPSPTSMQSFAIMRGVYDHSKDMTDPSAWEWIPVVGDKADGAKYTFGIDPARTRSGACTMMVMGDHLYIGEYNDTEIAVLDMVNGKGPQFMADNFEQSVNLYRLDKDDNVELVVGERTKMFPRGSLSKLTSGFGEKRGLFGQKKVDHGNQYIWKMEAFQDKLYIGTFDESVVLHPLGQLTNGDLIKMTREDWVEQLRYIGELIEALLKQGTSKPTARLLKDLEKAQQQMSLYTDSTFDALDLPEMVDGARIRTIGDLYRSLMLIPNVLDQDKDWTLDQKISSKVAFIALYEQMYRTYQALKVLMPQQLREAVEPLLNAEIFGTLHHLGRTLRYLSNCTEGFDMYVWDGKTMKCITRDGFGDPYNSGIRAFASNKSEENPWLTIGTANIFYGAQVWRLNGEGLNLPPVENFTVTFHGADGKTTSVTVPAKQAIGTAMPEDPTRESYEFLGWNTKADGTGDEVTAATVVTGDLDVYASWTCVDLEPEAFDVKFILTDGTEICSTTLVGLDGIFAPQVNGADVEWTADVIASTISSGDYLSAQTLDLDFTWTEKRPSIVFTAEAPAKPEPPVTPDPETPDPDTSDPETPDPETPDYVQPDSFSVKFVAADGSVALETTLEGFFGISVPQGSWTADCIDLTLQGGDYLSAQTLDLDFLWTELNPSIVFSQKG